MSIKDWIAAMLGRTQAKRDEHARVLLDTTEQRLAGRLSKLTGSTRDEVLAEAYRRSRRARLLEETDSYRRSHQ